MKNILIVIVVILVAFVGYNLINTDTTGPADTENTQTQAGADEQSTIEDPVSVLPVSHATMILTWGGSVLYTDPVGGAEVFSGQQSPDVVVITDIHGDHLSVETLEAVVTPDTRIVAPQAVADELSSGLLAQTTVLANGETVAVDGFSIEAIPMYNLPVSDDSRHTKGRGNGYVIERGGTRVYVAGDTADIPEMRALTGIDIAFIPMNLPYTMDIDAAADAVLAFAPKQVYPYHYRGQDGLSDVARFAELVNDGNPDIEVVQLVWYPDLEQPDTSEVVVDVSGVPFEFDVKEIKVSEGDTVTINFTTVKGLHDWVVDEFGAATEKVTDGETSSVTFVADKKGTFEYYCSVGNHRAQGMVGTLVVE